MSNLTKFEFVVLDTLNKNYLSWVLDTEIHLDAINIGNTIKKGNNASLQDSAKALIFLHHHIDEELKGEYLTVKDPFIQWNNSNHQKWNNSEIQPEKVIELQSKHTRENEYYRCGMERPWLCTYHTTKLLVDLYQASIKVKRKEVEMNFIDGDDLVDLTHLDVSNFFEDPNGKIDHLIGDGNVCYD